MNMRVLMMMMVMIVASVSGYTQEIHNPKEIWEKKAIKLVKSESGENACLNLSITNNKKIPIEVEIFTSLSGYDIEYAHAMFLSFNIQIDVYQDPLHQNRIAQVNYQPPTTEYGLWSNELNEKCSFCTERPDYYLYNKTHLVDLNRSPILAAKNCKELSNLYFTATATLIGYSQITQRTTQINPQQYSGCEITSIWPNDCYTELNNHDFSEICLECNSIESEDLSSSLNGQFMAHIDELDSFQKSNSASKMTWSVINANGILIATGESRNSLKECIEQDSRIGFRIIHVNIDGHTFKIIR